MCVLISDRATITCLFYVSGMSEILEGCCGYKKFLTVVSFAVFAEFEEKCESTGKAGVSGVGFMSGSQLVPWK